MTKSSLDHLAKCCKNETYRVLSLSLMQGWIVNSGKPSCTSQRTLLFVQASLIGFPFSIFSPLRLLSRYFALLFFPTQLALVVSSFCGGVRRTFSFCCTPLLSIPELSSPLKEERACAWVTLARARPSFPLPLTSRVGTVVRAQRFRPFYDEPSPPSVFAGPPRVASPVVLRRRRIPRAE